MSGGGASQVSSSTPWSAAQPYLTDIMGKASGLYGSMAPAFTNPSGNFNFGAETNAVGSALSGQPDYTAAGNAIGAANTQQWNQFYNNVIPQLNQRASFMENPTGAIKDLNSSITNLTQNQSLNAQQLMLGQYNNALQRQLQAASMYPGISQLPFSPLQSYAGLVSDTGGRFGNGSLSLNPGSMGTAANILGGLTAGSGLYSALFPQNGGGLGNAIVNGAGGIIKGLTGGGSTNPGGLGGFSGGDYSLGGPNAFDSFSMNSGFDPTTGTYTPPSADPYALPTTDPFTMNSGYDPTTGTFTNFNMDPFGSGQIDFSGAGGQAATQTGGSGVGLGLGDALGAYGAATGLASGNPAGEASGAIGAANLANKAGAFGSYSGDVGSGLGAAGGALGLYSGIKQGGVAGDAQAATSAAGLAAPAANAAGATGLGTALGAVGNVALPISLAYGIGSLYDMLDPLRQMTNQEIAATIPQQSPGALAAQAQNPMKTSNDFSNIDMSQYLTPEQMAALVQTWGHA